MTDFQSKLEALAQKKAEADAEARRRGDEANARQRQYLADMQTLIEGAFERPVRELKEKASALGLMVTTDPSGNSVGLNLRAQRASGVRSPHSLMVLQRGEQIGIEVIFNSPSKPSKSTMIQPHKVTEAWAETLLLDFVEAILGL